VTAAPRRAIGGTAAFAAEVPYRLHVPERCDGSLVVALHGMGQSAASFEEEALACAPDGAAVLVPQGPYAYEMRRREGPPRQGNAWYVFTGDSAEFVASMARTEDWLRALVGTVLLDAPDEALRPERARVALLGFSQGGYLAGFVGVRNPERFRAVVVAAGRIKDEVLMDEAPRAAAAGLRVLDASAERLAAAGVAVEFRTYPAAHAVLRDETCRADVRAFLAAALR